MQEWDGACRDANEETRSHVLVSTTFGFVNQCPSSGNLPRNVAILSGFPQSWNLSVRSLIIFVPAISNPNNHLERGLIFRQLRLDIVQLHPYVAD